MALSKVDLENQVENILPETLGGTGASQFPAQFRNIIINGDMSIAQRGTSESGITSSGYYTVDRYRTAIDSSGTWTQSQSTDVPSGQGFATSLKMDCTTANASLSSNSVLFLNQRFEGQNLQYLKKGTSNAESLTLSFWVKSNKTGTYIAELFDIDNLRQISKSYTISSANTWEKKTINFVGDTTGTLDNNNARSIDISLFLTAGTNYTSGTLGTSWQSYADTDRAVGQVNLADSTSNEWYITGVQLEAGTTASDFEFLPYDGNLQRCERYCYTYATYGAGNVGGNRVYCSRYSTSGSMVHIFFTQKMRVLPSLTYTEAGGTVSSDLSSNSHAQLFDSDDVQWHVYDFLAEAEL
jgi:hypothetical protein